MHTQLLHMIIGRSLKGAEPQSQLPILPKSHSVLGAAVVVFHNVYSCYIFAFGKILVQLIQSLDAHEYYPIYYS